MARRILAIVAMLMIGDGVLALLFPRRHLLAWKLGPPAFQEAMEEFAERPGLTRVIGGAEALLGLWLAFGQESQE